MNFNLVLLLALQLSNPPKCHTKLGITLSIPEFIQASVFLRRGEVALELGAGTFYHIITGSINGYYFPATKGFIFKNPFISPGFTYARVQFMGGESRFIYGLRLGNLIYFSPKFSLAYYLGVSYWHTPSIDRFAPNFGLKFLFF